MNGKIFPTFQSLADSVAAEQRWQVQIAAAQVIATDTSMGVGTIQVSGFVHGTKNTHVHIVIDVIPTTLGHPEVVREAPPASSRLLPWMKLRRKGGLD